MKCDELKAETIVPQGCTITLQMYPKAEVDAAIAELKDKCNMHDFFWEGCGFAKRGFKNTIAVSEAFDRLEAENAELKQELEDVKASHYAEMVDAGMRERRLKCALWLMTAEWAEGMGLASCNIAIKLSVKERFFYHDESNREKDIQKYRHRQVVFNKYADYCRKKAEGK